jgi:hypothetical protein
MEFVHISLVNALPAALMLLQIMLGEILPAFAAIFSPPVYLLVSFVIQIAGSSIGIIVAIALMFYFAFRTVEVFILTLMGQALFGLNISPLDGIATGILKRLFTIIFFGFAMMLGLYAFFVVVAIAAAMPSLLGVVLLIAAFLTLGKLKGLISELINEKSSFDGASWKAVPGALIVKREANKMQSKYIASRKDNNSNTNSGGTRKTGGGTTLAIKGGPDKSSTPKIKSAPTKTKFSPTSRI